MNAEISPYTTRKIVAKDMSRYETRTTALPVAPLGLAPVDDDEWDVVDVVPLFFVNVGFKVFVKLRGLVKFQDVMPLPLPPVSGGKVKVAAPETTVVAFVEFTEAVGLGVVLFVEFVEFVIFVLFVLFPSP